MRKPNQGQEVLIHRLRKMATAGPHGCAHTQIYIHVYAIETRADSHFYKLTMNSLIVAVCCSSDGINHVRTQLRKAMLTPVARQHKCAQLVSNMIHAISAATLLQHFMHGST